MTKKYDALVIGSGQGGTPLAIRLAKAGYKTALIERKWIGGTCINNGCIPSKAIIASANAAARSQQLKSLGINIDNLSVDFRKVMRRKDAIVERFSHGSTRSLEATDNLEVIFGTARFSANKELTVTLEDGTESVYQAGLVFINTGLRPLIPEIDGLAGVPFLTSTEILDLKERPQHLAILGAGYISLELGQALRRLGSKVTILESAAGILGKEDEDVCRELSDIMTKEGIKILTDTQLQKVAWNSDGKIKLTFMKQQQKKSINASHLLVAVGRVPDTDSLGISNTAIKTDAKGFIMVNDRLETNVKGVYAIGDIKGGPAFTHISYNDYRTIVRNLLEKKRLSVKNRIVPYCMFTDPQLGRVGLNEQQAKEQGIAYEVAFVPMSRAAKGIIDADTNGFLKAIVDKHSRKILGATMLCYDGGNMMSIVQMAMEAGFTDEDLRNQMFAHPTLAETINNLFFTLEK